MNWLGALAGAAVDLIIRLLTTKDPQRTTKSPVLKPPEKPPEKPK